MNTKELPGLFREVQIKKIFPDGKTFVDCVPKIPEREIETKFELLKDKPGFNLKTFVLTHFELPVPHSDHYKSDNSKSVRENIETLWDVLTREPVKKDGSLIPLPYPYIVPGGRFGEIYYWDSYFTMLGLKVSGRTTMIEQMVNNFAWLIDTIGYIPNGNRNYYQGRSQPPFFSLMLQLLSEAKGEQVITQYLPQLIREYQYWMKGSETLSASHQAAQHVLRMPDGEILNRYWDQNDNPRPESFREDCELAEHSSLPANETFRHLRAGAESGWDFSSRWFRDGLQFETIHTTEIVPVDLNLLIWQLEQTIAEACSLTGNPEASTYRKLAQERLTAIRKYCWNDKIGFYTDFDTSTGKQKDILSLAAAMSLFFNVATKEQAHSMQQIISNEFLHPGGLVATLQETGQQWDAPNGWAPLQWITIRGLQIYGYSSLAKEIAGRWIRLNEEVFRRTGKLMEKYNVVDISLEAGGGEYEGQDGFGWTNGVYLALTDQYKTSIHETTTGNGQPAGKGL
ncbi:MAG: alpha,alpha-trehalase TreF [Chitinophagaceae bacterium]|nr:alpha,alpha-trehalase TreF [Chitinophagaceae bacterium]